MWGMLAAFRPDGMFGGPFWGSLWGLAALPVLLAGCAVPLLLLAYAVLPARWLSGLGVDTVFLACLLMAPAVLMGGLSLDALWNAPPGWVDFEFRRGEPPRMDERWRHMLPNRPGRAPGVSEDTP
ncbi:MAG TPA: hypothetical protein VEY31_06490 [Roseococcus sp.]|nr:hypothetical protein [Roseococcus sp.]